MHRRARLVLIDRWRHPAPPAEPDIVHTALVIGTVKARLQPGRTALAHLLTIDHTGEARHV
jgi:hypothetical protein